MSEKHECEIWRWNYGLDEATGKQYFHSLTVRIGSGDDQTQVDIRPGELEQWKLILPARDVFGLAQDRLRATDPETLERLGIKL